MIKTLAIFLLLALPTLAESDTDYVLIAVNTNAMTQGQLNGLNVFLGEHYPERMLAKTWPDYRPRIADEFQDYTDGTNAWRVNCFTVRDLEKVRHTRTFNEDGTEDESKRKTHGRKVTALRIANIRAPYNGDQIKIERVPAGQQRAKLQEWALTAVESTE
jgi:hypothetical protein